MVSNVNLHPYTTACTSLTGSVPGKGKAQVLKYNLTVDGSGRSATSKLTLDEHGTGFVEVGWCKLQPSLKAPGF